MTADARAVVEEAYRAVNEGRPQDFTDFFHPDAEWRWPPRGLADTDVYRGEGEIMRGMVAWRDAWGEFRFEPGPEPVRNDEGRPPAAPDTTSNAPGLTIPPAPERQTSLQRALERVGEALRAAREDAGAADVFADVLVLVAAREAARLLERERRAA